jgi:dynein heavy chain
MHISSQPKAYVKNRTQIAHKLSVILQYLEGAAWDNEQGCLARQPPKVLIQEMPVIQVIPVEAHKLKLTGTFKAPVYVTSDRKNAAGVGMVLEADLDTREHSSHWTLQGTALVLNSDS